MDYENFGRTTRTRDRRIEIYRLKLNGFSTKDISRALKTPLSTVYKDCRFLDNELPLTVPDPEEYRRDAIDYWKNRLRYYTVKEREEPHGNIRVAYSKLKDSAMVEVAKLLGLYVEKIEDVSTIKEQIQRWLEVEHGD